MGKCVLCNASATTNVHDNASRTIYNCHNCGVFVLSDLVVSRAKRYRCELSAYLTSRKLAGHNEIILISYEKAPKDKDYLQLTVDQILERFPKSFSEQMHTAVLNLARLSSFEGDEIKVDKLEMFPYFYVRKISYDALSFMIKSLQQFELIEVNYYSGSFFPCGVIVSPKGWDQVVRLRGDRVRHETCLLLHSGEDTERNALFRRVVQKASRECGYDIVESDTTHATGKVGQELIGMIKCCAYIVTEMSGGGGAVYFTTGLAQALSTTNILTCHSDALHSLDIDTEQISVLHWQEEEDLYLQVLNAIRALVF